MNNKIYFLSAIFLIALLIFLPVSAMAFQVDFPVGVSETFNDNINNSDGNEEYDFITTLQAGIMLTSDWRAHTLSFSTNVYQDIYSRDFEQSNNSQDAQINYNRPLSRRSSITINDTFSHYPEPRTYDYMFGVTGGRNTYYTNILSINYQRYFTRFLGFNAHYQNNFTWYTSNETPDSRYNLGGASINYDWSSYNSTSIQYEFTYTEYDTGEKIPLHTAMLGHRFNFTNQLYTNLGAGFDYTVTADGEERSPHFLVSLIDDIDRRNQLNITFTKNYTMTPYEDDVFEQWQVSCTFTRQIYDRLGGNLNAFYGEGEYITTGIENMLIGFSIGFNYIIREEINGSINYTYTQNDTYTPDEPDTGYSVNTFSVSVNATF